jgi:putative effector of murein hydrolase
MKTTMLVLALTLSMGATAKVPPLTHTHQRAKTGLIVGMLGYGIGTAMIMAADGKGTQQTAGLGIMFGGIAAGGVIHFASHK